MEYEFKGWDWTELVPVFGLEAEFEKSENVPASASLAAEVEFGERLANEIRSYILRPEEEVKEIIIHLRAFLQKIIDCELGYDIPFWQGILNVEDDHTFLQIYAHNVTSMWT